MRPSQIAHFLARSLLLVRSRVRYIYFYFLIHTIMLCDVPVCRHKTIAVGIFFLSSSSPRIHVYHFVIYRFCLSRNFITHNNAAAQIMPLGAAFCTHPQNKTSARSGAPCTNRFVHRNVIINFKKQSLSQQGTVYIKLFFALVNRTIIIYLNICIFKSQFASARLLLASVFLFCVTDV
jgi:hypothetical protein